jgi:HAMP domain-containing protein
MAVGIGVVFFLSIGGAYLLAGAALKPVDAVTSAARKMGEGDLSKRLPVANPKDELGRLVITINALLSRLEAAFVRREGLSSISGVKGLRIQVLRPVRRTRADRKDLGRQRQRVADNQLLPSRLASDPRSCEQRVMLSLPLCSRPIYHKPRSSWSERSYGFGRDRAVGIEAGAQVHYPDGWNPALN